MKKIFISFIVVALLATSTSVFADTISSIGRKITAEYIVKLDGKQLPVKAVAFEGASYAPVRVISEALGLDVDFKNNEVLLTTIPESEGRTMLGEISEEVFKKIIEKVYRDRDNSILGLSATVNILKNHESGAYTLPVAEFKKHSESKMRYEAEIKLYDIQIADLKANYPEYAESSK